VSAPPSAQAEIVERAIARLPEECRQVIELHHRMHLSFADIARQLGRPPESVRALWARAIEALQRELGQS
jgi:RNA polymerase sigma factor (sigma-70 family)